MRLLVIDDAPDIATLLKLAFQIDGYAVDTALSGEEAHELVAVYDYDVLILDLDLPDMDGLEVCRAIRRTSSVPIVMLTRRRTEQERQQGLDAGANAYITKPFDAVDLLATVKTLL